MSLTYPYSVPASILLPGGGCNIYAMSPGQVLGFPLLDAIASPCVRVLSTVSVI